MARPSRQFPVILVRHLHREGLLKKRVLTRILLWAMAYKLRLPQDESWVRGAVFSSFEGKPQSEVDAYLERFYDEHIDRLFRKSADEEIARHRACGREVWAVTATFEPIIRRCAQTHGFTRQYSTRMRTDENGCYTCAVDGWPVEGIEKYNIVRRKADELYGPGVGGDPCLRRPPFRCARPDARRGAVRRDAGSTSPSSSEERRLAYRQMVAPLRHWRG